MQFTKQIIKTSSMDRDIFALNIGKNGLNNLHVIDNNKDFCLSLETGKIENIDFSK